jgi:hypothetical protein
MFSLNSVNNNVNLLPEFYLMKTIFCLIAAFFEKMINEDNPTFK